MSRPLSPSADSRRLRPLAQSPRSVSPSSTSTGPINTVPGYTATETGQEIARTDFHIARSDKSRRAVSDARDTSSNASGKAKKKGRLSGGFLLRPLTKLSEKRRESAPVLEDQTDGTPVDRLEASDGAQSRSNGGKQLRLHDMPLDERDGDADKARRSISMQARESKGKSRASSTLTDYPSPSTPESSMSAQQRVSRLSIDRPISRASSGDIDPSQIVRMALSLNESRRLGLAPGQLPAPGVVVSRRVASGSSALNSPDFAHRQQSRGLSPNTSTPLGDYLADSTDGGLGASRSPLLISATTPNTPQPPALFDGQMANEPRLGYILSAATILRAEKAKTFFELSHEYRRLLQALPPLGRHAQASSNGDLGRAYNPLQFIRNRKVRARERLPLDSTRDGWDNLSQVQSWVDEVEFEAQRDAYKNGDVVMLPPWHRPFRRTDTMIPASNANNIGGGQDTKPAKRLEWKIEPTDLLADAYWLEQQDHKALIEDKNGHKVFRRFRQPRQRQQSVSDLGDQQRVPSIEKPRPQDSTPPKSNLGDPSPPNVVSNVSDTDEGLQIGPSRHKSRPSRTSRMKRHILRRRHTISDKESSDSAEDDGSSMKNKRYISPTTSENPNTAPLEKHMRMMLQNEPAGAHGDLQRKRSTSDEFGNLRRGGVSEEPKEAPSSRRHSRHRAESYTTLSPRSSQDGSVGTPRISVDDYDDTKRRLRNPPTNDSSRTGSSTGKLKPFPFGFIHRRSHTREQNHIAENDFANGSPQARHSLESPRSSLALSSRSNSYKSLSEAHGHHRNRSEEDRARGGTISPRETPTRFFKGGRIGELVRTEVPRKSDFVWKKHPPRKGSTKDSPQQDSSDEDNFLSSRHRRLSRSATDLHESKYHPQHLPTFKSSHTRDGGSIHDPGSSHISDQQRAIREDKELRKSRFDKLGPLEIETSADVSPNTSQPDIHRYGDDGLLRPRDSRRPGESRSSSSSGVRIADQRLNQILGEPGVATNRRLPVTGLSNIEAKTRNRTRGPGQWNIADDHEATGMSLESAVTVKDIAFVRTLFASSGIKAHALFRRADSIPDTPADFLVKACENAGVPLSVVSRRYEHVVAARLLSGSLDKTISGFEDDADVFRNKTAHGLQTRIDDLRETAGSKLTPEVRSCGDDADALIAKLTTSHTLAVKQVNESIDLMMRSRWRRVRWFRKVGFKTLELVLVGFLWGIWLLVQLVRLFIGVFKGVRTSVRWLLWLQ